MSESKTLAQEFKEFISRGNVIDLAVGVIIGTAFGRIVTSIVEDIIMPPVGAILGGVNFSELKLVLREASTESGQIMPEVALRYGNFLQITFNFLIIAASVFLFVKLINRLKRESKAKEIKEEEKLKEKVTPESEEVRILREIRDALKK